MPISRIELESMLLKSFSSDEVIINDLAGDNDHWEVLVTSSKFQNKSLITQHKMVMDALGGKVGSQIHALSIKTKIKEE